MFLNDAPHGDRGDGVRDARLAERGADLVGRDLLVLEELHHQVVVVLGARLDHVVAVHLGVIGELGRDLADGGVDALVVLVEEDGVHLDEVDDADEAVLGTDGELDGHGAGAETVAHHLHDVVEVGAAAVHLVDVGDAGDAVGVGLAPHRLGLRLDATDGAEHGDGTVEDAQRALDLDREVNVPGRIDDLNAMVLPERSRRGGRDRDAALLLLDHPVHGRRAVVDLADLVRAAGVEQHALGRGRLAGVDVRHDPDVAGLIQWVLRGHK